MGPSRAGASMAVTKIAVGPSAPPMMPMEDGLGAGEAQQSGSQRR